MPLPLFAVDPLRAAVRKKKPGDVRRFFPDYRIPVLRDRCVISTSRYIVSDFLITDGSIMDATVSSSHIIDHIDVPGWGCASR